MLYPGEEEMLAVFDVLALAEDAMFVIDENHRIVFWKRSMERLLGYTHDEVAGRSCDSLFMGSDLFGNRYCSGLCPVHALARRGEPVRPFQLGLRAKDGRTVRVDIGLLKFTLRVSKRILIAHVVTPGRAPEATEPSAAPPAADTVPHLRDHADARVRNLTAREIEILGRLARGQSATTIADELTISPLTARNHIQHMFEKLEVHSRSEAVAFAYRMHLV